MPFIPYSDRCSGVHADTGIAVEVRNLNVNISANNEWALNDITVTIGKGESVALVGANGAGKSTFLKTTAGLLDVASGKIFVFGHHPGICRHRTAYLPQRVEIDWKFPMTIRNLVVTGSYVKLGWFNMPGQKEFDKVDSMLDLLQLKEIADQQIGQLSGGLQQRALLARALVHEADLLLLDEPMNAVDKETRKIFGQVLGELHNQGKTVIIATHELGRFESSFDSVIHLHDGKQIGRDFKLDADLDRVG